MTSSPPRLPSSAGEMSNPVTPWETHHPTTPANPSTRPQQPQQPSPERRASLFSLLRRRHTYRPLDSAYIASNQVPLTGPARTTPATTTKHPHFEIIADTAPAPLPERRRSSVETIVQCITIAISGVFRRRSTSDPTATGPSYRYSLDLPEDVSRDKSELEYLRRKNIEAWKGNDINLLDAEDEVVEIRKMYRDSGVAGIMAEETRVAVHTDDEVVETSLGETGEEWVEYAPAQAANATTLREHEPREETAPASQPAATPTQLSRQTETTPASTPLLANQEITITLTPSTPNPPQPPRSSPFMRQDSVSIMQTPPAVRSPALSIHHETQPDRTNRFLRPNLGVVVQVVPKKKRILGTVRDMERTREEKRRQEEERRRENGRRYPQPEWLPPF